MRRYEKELEKVRLAHRGRLKPQHVVEAARADKTTALYAAFDKRGLWDDKKAAEAARLQYARDLIQTITFLPKGSDEPIRSYVSLSSDRLGRGGYRAMAEVMTDKQLLAQLIEDASNELQAYKLRYERLRKVAKFAKLFVQIDKVTE